MNFCINKKRRKFWENFRLAKWTKRNWISFKWTARINPKNVSRNEDKFYTSVEIDNKQFMFTQLNGGDVMSWVEDKQNPGKWKTRLFRFSKSDHQWKSLPGEQMTELYEGDENSPLHHYVQSAKLDKRIYKIIILYLKI